MAVDLLHKILNDFSHVPIILLLNKGDVQAISQLLCYTKVFGQKVKF